MLSLIKFDELSYSSKAMIPNFQILMLPELKAANKGITRNHDIISFLATEFELTDEERETLLPSKTQRTFDNRVYWAISYLKQAGLLKQLARGVIEITDIGKKVLADKPERIDIHFLYKFPEFREFEERKSANGKENRLENNSAENSATPDEVIRLNYKQLNDTLAADLLERILQASPQFFEQLLIDLLLAMGAAHGKMQGARLAKRMMVVWTVSSINIHLGLTRFIFRLSATQKTTASVRIW